MVKYNSIVDRIVLDDVEVSIVGLDEIEVSQGIGMINDAEQDWIDDCLEPVRDLETELEQMHEQELTNLRVLEWLRVIDSNLDIWSILGDWRGRRWVFLSGEWGVSPTPEILWSKN